MSTVNWSIEQERHELKTARYRNLITYLEWTEFVKDIKEQIEVHKNLSVSFAQQNKMDDAKRQACIVAGLEEAINHPQSVISYHENTFKKLYRHICASCGNFVKWGNKAEVKA